MQNKITITLLAAISKDGFLADSNGNGDFSSQADKMHLRSFLRSNACDCFISGRKTAEEFKERLTYKPLFILSSTDHTNKDNIHYINGIDDFIQQLNGRNLSRPALLGGAQTYNYFLNHKAVDTVLLTVENLNFYAGIPFKFQPRALGFRLVDKHSLDKSSILYHYDKIRAN